MKILDGKYIAEEETKKIKNIISNSNLKIKFGIIQVGDVEESNKYIANKIKKANEVGIEAHCIKFDERISEQDLIDEINSIQDIFDGLIVQLPLPNHIVSQNVLDVIKPENDIDGLSSENARRFYNDEYPHFIPATARAILLMLEFYKIDLKKNIMVIGESNLVGKPTKKLLSKFAKKIESRNKQTGIEGSENYDILIVATGNPNLIKKENVKKGSIVIDVGITVLDNKKMVGDVDFNDVKDKVGAISPVPGGVGPLTVISLLKNLIDKSIKL